MVEAPRMIATEGIVSLCKTMHSTVRQKYGWYLDDRSETDKRHLTNAGWSEWTAAMCGPRAVADLYARLKRFAQETPDRWSLTDYYNAVDAKRLGFEGRAQMGGFGASLALAKYPHGLLPHARARRSKALWHPTVGRPEN